MDDGVNAMPTLLSDPHGIMCYAIEGNTVDRASRKNGKGWCENISPTLNTQDRHAIAYPLFVDNREVTGADIYNFSLTENVGRCLSTSGGGLNEHIPVVIIGNDNE